MLNLPEGSAHGFVVHVWFVLVHAPQPRNGLRVDQLENATPPIRPFDISRTRLFVLQQLQQELPQVRRTTWGERNGGDDSYSRWNVGLKR